VEGRGIPGGRGRAQGARSGEEGEDGASLVVSRRVGNVTLRGRARPPWGRRGTLVHWAPGAPLPAGPRVSRRCTTGPTEPAGATRGGLPRRAGAPALCPPRPCPPGCRGRPLAVPLPGVALHWRGCPGRPPGAPRPAALPLPAPSGRCAHPGPGAPRGSRTRSPECLRPSAPARRKLESFKGSTGLCGWVLGGE